MVVRKTLTALGLSAALAMAPALVYAQSQAAKTGTGAQIGATAGQDESTGAFGLTTTQIALVAALGIGALVLGVAALSDDDDDDPVPGSTTTTTTTSN
jgi:hypothetical protein